MLWSVHHVPLFSYNVLTELMLMSQGVVMMKAEMYYGKSTIYPFVVFVNMAMHPKFSIYFPALHQPSPTSLWPSSRFINISHHRVISITEAFSEPCKHLHSRVPPSPPASFVLPSCLFLSLSVRAHVSTHLPQFFQAISSHCAVWFKDPVAHIYSLLFRLHRARRLLCKALPAHTDFTIIVHWGGGVA